MKFKRGDRVRVKTTMPEIQNVYTVNAVYVPGDMVDIVFVTDDGRTVPAGVVLATQLERVE